MRMKERIVKISKSTRKGKKYMALVQNNATKRQRTIHFGASAYAQYRDSTKLKLFAYKDHKDQNRRKNYFSRHSGVRTKRAALAAEKGKSGGEYTPKILSHQYLW